MALTHTTAVRNSISDGVVDQIDLGVADANGDLVYATAGDVEVSVGAFANPAFGASVNGVATANTITDDPSSAGGTVAIVIVRDRDNTELFRGSVTAIGGGGDAELTSVVIVATEPIKTTSMTYTAST